MSSFLCFVCHSTVNADTNEETREKYREVIGMHLCPESHLCYICCYFLNKMWMFKSICLKRSLEYPVLFSEKGTINLHRSETSVSILCPEDICIQHLNTRIHFYNNSENSQSDFDDNNYCELQDDRIFDLNDTLIKTAPIENFRNEDYLFVTKDNIEDNLFNVELLLPNLEPVRITQNDLVNGKWTENVTKNDINKNNTLIELNSCKNDGNIEGIVRSVITGYNNETIVNNNNATDSNSIAIHNNHPITMDNNHPITMDNNINTVVLSIGDKHEHVIGCNVQQHFQDVLTNHNLHYSTINACYEQVNNHGNMNIEHNLIFKNEQSNSIMNLNVERNVNEIVNNINDTVRNINEPINNINTNLANLNVQGRNITETVNNLNKSVTNKDDAITNESNIRTFINNSVTNLNNSPSIHIAVNTSTNINEAITNINETLINTNDSKTNINKNLMNTIDSTTNIKETFINTNDSATNINETIKNMNENETDTLENTSFEDVNIPEQDNHSELEETREKISKSKKNKRKTLYDKVFLTLEEQKAELEKARKDEKYITAAFKCHSCAMHFHFKDTYQAHMMRHEESNGEHSCSICSLRFANPAVLRLHTANHGVRFKCRICSEEVRAKQRQTHARSCAGNKDSVNCHICGKIFQCGQHFQQHMQLYHAAEGSNKSYLCNVCGKSYSTRGRVRTHMICGQHFQQHMQRYHAAEGSNKSYLCNVCGKSYSTRGRVRTHMITHINRKFECDLCSSTFSSPYTLNQHKKLKHFTLEPQVHHCASCNITYNSRKSLLAHMRNSLAHKDSVYKCNICSRTCPSMLSLCRHTASVHTRPKHLACTLCHKLYSTHKALVKHMSSHKEGKPVPLCHSCGVTFKSTTNLKRHLKNVCEKDRKCHNIIDEDLLQVPFFE